MPIKLKTNTNLIYFGFFKQFYLCNLVDYLLLLHGALVCLLYFIVTVISSDLFDLNSIKYYKLLFIINYLQNNLIKQEFRINAIRSDTFGQEIKLFINSTVKFLGGRVGSKITT